MFGEQFYPTPPELANEILRGVGLDNVQFIIDPSAGKGDLLSAVAQRIGTNRPKQLDCVEIDPDLQAVLKGRGYSVVGNDFLEFHTFQRYDLCVMNPPFSNGDKHLLHALKMMERGGTIVCILNAETLKNPHTNTRMDLTNRLQQLDAVIEYRQGAFLQAERRTGVEIAIVKVSIPRTEERDLTGNLKEAVGRVDTENQANELAENDFLKILVKQYDMSAAAGVRMIEDAEAMAKYLPNAQTPFIEIHIAAEESHIESKTNRFLRQLRYEFWKRLFQSDNMSRLMTNEVRKSYMAQLHKMRAYDFNLYNIKQIQIELSQSLIENTEQAILKMFDKFTYQHSMEKNGNIHYYDGWKTNKACKVNKKVIVSCWGLYENRCGWSFYKAGDTLDELEKILTYLDGGNTEGKSRYDVMKDMDCTNGYTGEFVKFKYFDVSFKKKGTLHIVFTDENLLKKFNVFGANKKGWLPPSYGKRQYKDMTAEEKSVVKSFEGEKEYEKTMQAPTYYLGGAELKMLGA